MRDMTPLGRGTVNGNFPIAVVPQSFRLLAIEHDDVPHLHDEVAAGFLGEERSEFLLLLLELVELHLDQFVVLQAFVHALEKLKAEAGFADLERGLHPLRGGFESADFRIGEAGEHEVTG
jgi:hypothetical protein